ncbi:DUF1566 domain-containing protein [Legionella feeleii]|uniref:Legionella vir region protein n=1 Tax=Legionella feeleii TaxID=453 RepID=A0A378IXH4_9GAMM|nr:DUF1566 domain-containing protein [Legionella feeleii]STX39285.1 Legionella vir region protein [Legionella feeleii]
MRNLIFAWLMLSSTLLFASNEELWLRIDQLNNLIAASNNKIHALETNLAVLKTQVAQIPTPIRYQAGEGISLEGFVIKARFPKHHVGELYRGGIVFQVDESGQHGLIAAKIDAKSAGIQWRNGTSGNKTTNARADGIGAGETNTRLIVAAQTIDNQAGQFAALIASSFKVSSDGLIPCTIPATLSEACYGNWYLPSAFELQLMYSNLYQAGLSAFEQDTYWSSTESSVANAWLLDFANGELATSQKSRTRGRVRPISRF